MRALALLLLCWLMLVCMHDRHVVACVLCTHLDNAFHRLRCCLLPWMRGLVLALLLPSLQS